MMGKLLEVDIMAEFKSGGMVNFTLWINLNESESRALEAITLYGSDKFLEFFYEKLGRSYLEPHEKGIRSLFATITDQLPPHLKKADKARAAFKN